MARASVAEVRATLERLAREVAEWNAAGRLHGAIASLHRGGGSAGQELRLDEPAAESILLDGADLDCCPPELRGLTRLVVPHGVDAARSALQALGADCDPRRIDVYQLGTLAYRLLTGRTIDAYLRSPKAKASVPRELRTLIDQALGYEPGRRFPDAAALIEALGATSDANHPEPPVSAAAGKPRSPALSSDTAPSVFAPAAESDTHTPRARPPGSSSETSELPFQKLGPYEVVSRLGRGGMGDVYKGYDRSLDRTVAIKVLPPELARHDDLVARFQAEATAAARLAHPNITQVYFIGEDQRHQFFAMQYVEGASLAELLERRGRIPVDECLSISEEVLCGLAAAHATGLIHRDVKPGNILLDRQHQRVLLADFGLVKFTHAATLGTATGVVMGTVDYISPEQGRGLKVDARTDLYSLGVVLFQMLSGRLPFEADSPTALIFQHVYEPPPRLEAICVDVPRPLACIVARLLEKSPEDRYATADDVLADLRAFREDRPLPSGTDRRRSEASGSGADSRGTPAGPVRLAGPAGRATQIIPAPEYEPLPEIADAVLAGALVNEGETRRGLRSPLWARAQARFRSLFHRHAPQFVRRLQNTQQQIDGAIYEYERRQRELRQLIEAANDALEELGRQQIAWREAEAAAESRADREADPERAADVRREVEDCRRQAADLGTQADDQRQQIEAMQLRLAQVSATLERLRSQRDVLNARLEAARAGVLAAGGQRRPHRRRIRTAGLVAGLVLVMTVLALPFIPRRESRDAARGPNVVSANAQSAAGLAPEARENLTPLVRFYNTKSFFHMYTHNEEEANAWRRMPHLKEQRLVGNVSPVELPGTVRLWRAVRKVGSRVVPAGSGRHYYYVKAPRRMQNVVIQHREFHAYVWTTPGDGRIPIYGSTWTDETDAFFDSEVNRVLGYSENTRNALGIARPDLGVAFYIYPHPAEDSKAVSNAASQTAASQEWTWLDDLPVAYSSVGHGQLGLHGSTGFPEGEMQRCRKNGTVVSHAVSMHPPRSGQSVATFHLDGRFAELEASTGIMAPDASDGLAASLAMGWKGRSISPLRFRAFGDGKVLWSSPWTHKSDEWHALRVDVSGVRELRLTVDCQGPHNFAWATWIEAKLFAPGTNASPEVIAARPEEPARDESVQSELPVPAQSNGLPWIELGGRHPYPEVFQPNDQVHGDKDGLSLNRRHYVMTRDGGYLTRDFRFEIVYTLNKGDGKDIVFIGIGEADRNVAYNEPKNSVYLRIHPPNVDAGIIGLSNRPVSGGASLGHVPKEGTHRAIIEKHGQVVRFAIDVDNDGASDDDFERIEPDIGAFAPFLHGKNTHLFFGGGGTFRRFRITEAVDPHRHSASDPSAPRTSADGAPEEHGEGGFIALGERDSYPPFLAAPPQGQYDEQGLRLPREIEHSTKDGSFLTKDFTFEIVFEFLPAGDHIALIGLGEPAGSSGRDRLHNVVYMRVRPPYYGSGGVSVTNDPGGSGGFALGRIPSVGPHRAVIDKRGDVVTFRIDVDNDGATPDDLETTIPNIRAIGPSLHEKNTPIFFGNAGTWKAIRLTEHSTADSGVPPATTADGAREQGTAEFVRLGGRAGRAIYPPILGPSKQAYYTPEGMRLHDAGFATTKDASFLAKDFTFEVVFDFLPAGDNMALVGLGEPTRDGGRPGLHNVVSMRILPPYSGSGGVRVTGDPGGDGGFALGHVRSAGPHRAIIEKDGNAVTFRIDVDNDGPTPEDLEITLPNIKAMAPFLHDKNTHIFFGNAGTYRAIRLTDYSTTDE